MRTAAALALMLVAGACGSAAGRPAERLHGTVTYTVSGGLAGIHHHLRVAADGRASVTGGRPARRHRFTVSARDRSRLAAALRKADIAHVRVSGKPPIADALRYDVTYRHARVAFSDGNVPRRLRPLLRLLDRLLARR